MVEGAHHPANKPGHPDLDVGLPVVSPDFPGLHTRFAAKIAAWASSLRPTLRKKREGWGTLAFVAS
jgi:hypothetical protein